MTRAVATVTESATTKNTKSPKDTISLVRFVVFAMLVVFVAGLATPLRGQAPERIAEIRVHGNHTTPDADVLALSGLKVGDAAGDDRLQEAERAIRASHRFTDVEIRRRYLSISDPTQVLVMIVVNEKAGISDADLTPGIGKRIRASGMFLPILSYADGYGFTYGVRTTFPHVVDDRTRVSVPLSWGGERRAGVEVERWFGGSRGFFGFGASPPVVKLSGALSEYRRVNPYYDAPDRREEARLRIEHPFRSWLRVGAGARTARVTFGRDSLTTADSASPPPALLVPPRTVERHDAFGADVVFDTRLDPSFPRNAVYASLGREALRWEHGIGTAGRWLTDLRGYAGIGGSAVLALRAQFATSDRALPPSEQVLLGGTDTLRGYRAGAAAGDNLGAISTEVRLPLTSPLNAGRFGVKGFVDWGTTWSNGSRFADATWQRGIGGGIFFGGGPVILDLAAAWPEHGSGRINFGLGVSF